MASQSGLEFINTELDPGLIEQQYAQAQPAFLTADQVGATGAVLPVTQGGTGANNITAARTALGAAASGANNDITSLAGLTTPLSIAQGGTGAATAANARASLGIPKFNSALVAPGVNDDTAAGYSVNSLWTDTVLDDGYLCVDATNGAAVWKKITV
jgi:hypothetical protein